MAQLDRALGFGPGGWGWALLQGAANTISVALATLPFGLALGLIIAGALAPKIVAHVTQDLGGTAREGYEWMGWVLGGVIAAIDTFLVNGIKEEPVALHTVTAVAAAIGAAMIGHVLSAALLGACTPIIVKRLRGDPAMISTPAVTAIADLTGAAIYLVTGTLMLAD